MIQVFTSLCQMNTGTIRAHDRFPRDGAMGMPINKGVHPGYMCYDFFTCPWRGGSIVAQMPQRNDLRCTCLAHSVDCRLNVCV